METNKPLKKTKKVMLIVFLVLISISVLSPIVYKVFMPKYGRLIYNVNPSMATLSGDFASLGIHNKTDTTVSLIGKNGTKGKEVSVQEKMGYAFLGWDDGLMSHNRIDYYDGGVKEYKAVCDFYANEIPNVVFMSDYGNDRTNFKAVIYYGDIVENENIGAVSFITDYENYQGQSKKNFLLHSTSGGFFNKGYLKAYSLFYDKTCLRQLFAISLYNNIFDEKIKYEIASVYFNYEYYGLYVFVDYSFLVNEKPDLIINRSNSKDDKGVNFNNRNYKYIFGTSGLHGDKKLIDVLDSIGSSSGFAFDEESFVRRAVLNTFLNNSSQDENDMIFSIKNNAIKLSPIDSFSLSSGLFGHFILPSIIFLIEY